MTKYTYIRVMSTTCRISKMGYEPFVEELRSNHWRWSDEWKEVPPDSKRTLYNQMFLAMSGLETSGWGFQTINKAPSLRKIVYQTPSGETFTDPEAAMMESGNGSAAMLCVRTTEDLSGYNFIPPNLYTPILFRVHGLYYRTPKSAEMSAPDTNVEEVPVKLGPQPLPFGNPVPDEINGEATFTVIEEDNDGF